MLAFFGSGATDLQDIPVMQNHAHTALSFGWQAGVGAIFGLMGGKLTSETES